jgi:NAD+ synthase
MIVPSLWRDKDNLYNAALLLEKGQIETIRYKYDLPNYGVFDEKRVFTAGPLPDPINFCNISLGIPICEDIWTPIVTTHLAKKGTDIFLVPNGSPYEIGKLELRRNLVRDRVAETRLPLVYLNQVGGQDELVFDGGSFIANSDGSFPVQLPQWRESVTLTQWCRMNAGWSCTDLMLATLPSQVESIYQAMMMGLRDYVRKSHFQGVLIGLSGGIDSALSAAVATDALGPSHVHCVMMPSRYTSQSSLDDATACAGLLGVRLDTIPIMPAVDALTKMLAGELLAGLLCERLEDTTEENIQSRIRGVILMALSNRSGYMVLTTSNKSEMATGYATLYGDMCGGYSVLKDVYKLKVYELSRWRNQKRPDGGLGPSGYVIPDSVLIKPPTAELKPNQTDESSLMPYAELDPITEALVDLEQSADSIVTNGWSPASVSRVQTLLLKTEYKRRQAPPGVKISRKSFGRDRRYPIVNEFQG